MGLKLKDLGGIVSPMTLGMFSSPFKGKDATPQQTSTPNLYGAQVPIMDSMSTDLMARLGKPASEYSKNPYVRDFFGKYGDWDSYVRGRVAETYNPQSTLDIYKRNETNSEKQFNPRVSAEWDDSPGNETYKQEALASAKQDRGFQRDTAMYQQNLARNKALYQNLKMTPQALKTLDEMDQTYSDPTKSAEWGMVKKLLGLETQSTASWITPAKDPLWMSMLEGMASTIGKGYGANSGYGGLKDSINNGWKGNSGYTSGYGNTSGSE